MDVLSTLQTYRVPERFERAMKAVRGALGDMDLDIVEEFDFPDAFGTGPERRNHRCKVLLVSCPVLDFEALTLGRAAAVFFPLHVMVTAEGDGTRVSLVNPTALFDSRLPVGAINPMNRLVARVELAMESLLEEADSPKLN
jgi:uncharacterized protein (DUF302 family)